MLAAQARTWWYRSPTGRATTSNTALTTPFSAPVDSRRGACRSATGSRRPSSGTRPTASGGNSYTAPRPRAPAGRPPTRWLITGAAGVLGQDLVRHDRRSRSTLSLPSAAPTWTSLTRRRSLHRWKSPRGPRGQRACSRGPGRRLRSHSSPPTTRTAWPPQTAHGRTKLAVERAALGGRR